MVLRCAPRKSARPGGQIAALLLARVSSGAANVLDLRYRETRGSGGVRASEGRQRRSEAYARAQLAQRRLQRRSELAYGYEDGPKNINPFAGIDISRARSQERSDRDQVFQQEGSGVYGARQSMNEARRGDEQQQGPLLGW